MQWTFLSQHKPMWYIAYRWTTETENGDSATIKMFLKDIMMSDDKLDHEEKRKR